MPSGTTTSDLSGSSISTQADEQGARLKIVTHYEPKPIPDRRFDWSAYDDATYGGEPSDPVGYGTTEQDAIADLREQEEMRRG